MADRPDSTRGSAARHGTASRVAHVTEKKKVPWLVIGVAAVLVVAIVAYLFNDPNKDERNFGKALESPDARGFPTARGQRGAFKLGDSTAVQLGPETSLKVPPNFNTQVRGAGLVGTAKFTPLPGTGEKPLSFRVRARKVALESKGGSFIVSAYAEDKEVFVKAITNALTVRPSVDEKESVELAVGPGMAISDSGKTRQLTQAESDGVFSWADGNYTLTAIPLSGTVPVLQRWFNTPVMIGDKSLESRPVTAVLPLASSKEALTAIGAAASVHIAFRGDTLTLVDGADKAAAPAKKKGK